MENVITGISETMRLIEEKRYSFFTFPELGITVKYRKPDVLKLALQKSLPGVMADMVITAYRKQISGEDTSELAHTKIDADEEFLVDLSAKSYQLLSDLCVSHKFMNVQVSDFDTTPPLISYIDVPEQDAMAFLMHIINAAQTATTTEGGEISAGEVTDFPQPQRGRKRNSASQNG